MSKWAAINQSDTVNYTTYVGDDVNTFCSKASLDSEGQTTLGSGTDLQTNNPELSTDSLIKCESLADFNNAVGDVNSVCQIISDDGTRAKYQTNNIGLGTDDLVCACYGKNPDGWKRISGSSTLAEAMLIG